MRFTTQPATINLPNCKMRLGKLSEYSRLPNSVFLTPLLLLYTKGGSVSHLTREVLEMVTNVSSQALQIPMANSASCYESIKHFKEGISTFAGLPECLSFCTVQDPAEETKSGYNEKNLISIWTQKGRKQLTADKYMDMVEAFRPDIYQSLCDADTKVGATSKRVHKAVLVSNQMMVACAERHAKSERLIHSSLLASVEGGYDLEARRDSACLAAMHPSARGFVIDGLHANGPSVEHMAYETLQPVIDETLKHLPEDRPRLAPGGWRPDVVLSLVRAGVDIFDSSLVHMVTERGCAFTFTYKYLSTSNSCNGGGPVSNGTINGHHLCEDNRDDTICMSLNKENEALLDVCSKTSAKNLANEKIEKKEGVEQKHKKYNNYEINLNDKMYFDDLTPVVRGCQCLTCRKHTRAYIHHLFNTKEMLASVLLTIHNLHHYQQFFHTIRESGEKGELLTIDPPFS